MLAPAVFFGHGNPMNAISDNRYTRAWRKMGRELEKPRAIVCISAHWYVPGTFITAMEWPRTIHDFGGFPPELFAVRYPAPGDPALARRVAEILSPQSADLDLSWGLDHGTWSVLAHVFPEADVPTVQVSLDETQPPAFHYEIGRRLSPLRDEGILIVGSGNVVHNMHAYAWGRHKPKPFDWATRFESRVRSAILAADDETLVNYEAMGKDALLSAPTPDHYLPLLVVLGARQPQDSASFPVEGVDGESISMLSVNLG
jgi:4,5-DOPA dioxygenase extradiol